MLGYAVFVMGGEAGVRLKDWNDQQKINKSLAEVVRFYYPELNNKQDVYGSKNPDKTLAMFKDAVQKEDYELAKKYIASNEARSNFDEVIKKEEKLKRFIEGLNKIEKEDDHGHYTINNYGEYSGSIVFHQSLNGIWKIIQLYF